MTGLKERLAHSLTAQVVLSFAIVMPLSLLTVLIEPGEALGAALVRGVLVAAGSAVFLVVRQLRHRALTGGVDALVTSERRLTRGQVPEDPAGREAMRGLLAQRRGELRRSGRALPFFVLMLAALPMLFLKNGRSVDAVATLVLGAAFVGFLLVMRRRNLRRVQVMEKALAPEADAPDARASAH